MSVARHHNEWLSLVEASGPFLSLPVLLRVFPQGLDARDPGQASRLRGAYEEWLERGAKNPGVHHAWIRHVLQDVLGYPSNLLTEGQAIPPGLDAVMATFGETLRPDMALKHRDAAQKPVLLVSVYGPGQDLEKPVSGKHWKASPGTRMMELLHAADIPVGLVTNGEKWMLVSARRAETTGFASWYADLWMQEPLTLRGFHSLLHLRRLIGVAHPETLPALLLESSKDQQEVTDQLGYQVRQAVEVLVQAFDRIDAESGRTLLASVDEKTLYDGALTVMMRLVFLFSAEERGLLLLGDPQYDQNYAVSTLSELLRERADQHGEEVLERRHDAWCRLLATFRAVHAGVEHEAMRLPPYGGTLFDPDRYPFLEGRGNRGLWQDGAARPLVINNRVVLHLLEALQVLRVKVPGGPAEARRVSFSALDIEQIGHVYEGLLDHTARRAAEPMLGLAGSRDQEPEVPLGKLEELALGGPTSLVAFLHDETGRSERALTRLLAEPLVSDKHELLIACGQDDGLAGRVTPFTGLLRRDSFGHLVVVRTGSIYVTAGNDRRSTGTHYTPRSLTEPVVKHTLEPLVYTGPAQGLPPEEWELRNAQALLGLKVCDMAMGSGAFLVEACRYLAARLVEAWENAEREHPGSFVVTPDGGLSTGSPAERLIPVEPAERLAIARRYVADRCLYGVDINPMAVEMAKLSLWLVTLQRDRPFTFLDHALKCGDSLLGVSTVKQVENFSLRPDDRQVTFGTANLRRYLEHASVKRRALESLPSNDYAQIRSKDRLHAEAQEATANVRALADVLITLELHAKGDGGYEAQRADEAERLQQFIDYDASLAITSQRPAATRLSAYAREQLQGRRTFHWPVEFPEVFDQGGFDALVGNPPFMGGTLATDAFGADYMGLLQRLSPPWHGKADYVVGFFKRAATVSRRGGTISFIATSSVLRGESLESGLRDLSKVGYSVYAALSPYRWPGTANVEVVNVSLAREWSGEFDLDGKPVDGIAEDLSPGVPNEPVPFELSTGGLHGYLGVKLSPANREVPLTVYERARSAAPELEQFYVPAVGGAELYDVLDVEDAKRAIDPDMLASFLQRGGVLSQHGGITVGTPESYTHSAPASSLAEQLRTARLAFACGETSTVLRFVEVPTRGCILKHKLVVFPTDTWATFALLQSDLHAAWCWRWGLRRKRDLVYSPKRCASTFPLPACVITRGNSVEAIALAEAGHHYHETRKGFMRVLRAGLTKIYNRVHDRRDESDEVVQLRALQAAMDNCVAKVYGWEDLNLDHGFHESPQGLRYTLSETARRAVLSRLVSLNHQRHADAIKAGLNSRGGTRSGRGTQKLVGGTTPKLLGLN